MAEKPIIVTVTDQALGKIDELKEKLIEKGMKVSRVMPLTGVITGSCSSAKISDLQQVDGVMSVEEELSAGF